MSEGKALRHRAGQKIQNRWFVPFEASLVQAQILPVSVPITFK